MAQTASNVPKRTFQAVIVGHNKTPAYYTCWSPRMKGTGAACDDFATRAALSIQTSHDLACQCGAKVDVNELYYVNVATDDPKLRLYGRSGYDLPRGSIHVDGEFPVGHTRNCNPNQIQFLIHPSLSLKRKASLEAPESSNSAKRARAASPTIQPIIGPLLPVGQSADEDRPIYLVGSIDEVCEHNLNHPYSSLLSRTNRH